MKRSKFLIIFFMPLSCYPVISPQQAQKVKEICKNNNFSSAKKLEVLHNKKLIFGPDVLDSDTKKLIIPILESEINNKSILFNYYKESMFKGLLKLSAPVNIIILMRSYLSFNCESSDLMFCNLNFVIPSFLIVLCSSLYLAKNSLKKIETDIDAHDNLKRDVKALETYKQLLEK